MEAVSNIAHNAKNLSTTTAWKRKQWHGPYFDSMRLELMHNREGCEYEGEYILNTKPLQIDMLAKASGEVTWAIDEITHGFRKHNILEFKSPDDDLNLDVFYKTLGYGCLYKAQESYVDEILPTEITITFIRERKPEKLLKQLEALYGIEVRAPGIYYIRDSRILFPVQILVLREMDWKQHIWITALKKHISTEHARQLIQETLKLQHTDEKAWADSVLQLAMANNILIFNELKEDEFMCQALRELMADEITEELYDAECRGEQTGARRIIDLVKRLKNGESAEQIQQSGIKKEMLDLAVEMIQL